MPSRWDLSEDFHPFVFFLSRGEASPAEDGPEPADEAEAIARLAARLRDLSDRYWVDYCTLAETRRPPQDAAELQVGQIIVVSDLPAQPGNPGGGKAKVEPIQYGGHTVALHAGTLHALERVLHRAEAHWKLRNTGPREMALVLEEPGKGGVALGADATGLVARPQVMRSRDGLVAFDVPGIGPRVPGARSAVDLLQDFRDGHKAVSTAQPEEILEPLRKSLAEGDIELFARLWVSGLNVAVHRRRFAQFQKAFTEGGGSLRFARFDERQSPEAFEQNKQVRMYVARKRADGSEGVSPLVLVKEGDDWRLKTGTI